MPTCDLCGRPTWERTQGMGGGLLPDYDTHCIQRGNRMCRKVAGMLVTLSDQAAVTTHRKSNDSD